MRHRAGVGQNRGGIQSRGGAQSEHGSMSRGRAQSRVGHEAGVGHRAGWDRAGVEYRAGVGERTGVVPRAGTLATSVKVNKSAHTHLLFVSLHFSKNVFFQFHRVSCLYTHIDTVSNSLAIARILGMHFSGLRKQIRLTKLGACYLATVLEVAWL